MSNVRDLLWYRTTWTAAQTTNMAAADMVTATVVADVDANVVDGPLLVDAHKRMRGTVEDVRIAVGNTNANLAVTIFFYSASGMGASTASSDRTLDYVEVAKGDFDNGDISFAALNSQEIHHFDRDTSKSFRVGVRLDAPATTDLDGIAFEWSFRPDIGGR